MKAVFVFLFIVPVVAFARDFQTERPTRTRTPYTINKSELAVESEVVNYRDDEETDTHELNVLKSLFRFGITPHSEIQAELAPYSSINDADGIGDTRLGFKTNVLGMMMETSLLLSELSWNFRLPEQTSTARNSKVVFSFP